MFDALRRVLRSAPALPALDPVHGEQLVAAMRDARAGGAAAVDELSSLLIEVDRTGDAEVRSLAVGLLAEGDAALWKSLDLASRRTWWRAREWTGAARERLRGDPGPLALVVASFHPDGFVREAAVARLGEIDDPVALPALALRAADWVAPVRDRARAALERPMPVRSLLDVGPLAVLLADRAQGGWLVARLEEAMSALADADLHDLLGAPDRRLRRAAYSVAMRDGRLGRGDLLRAVERDNDRVIRVACADAAIRAAVAAGAVDDVRPLTASGTAAVRAAAVWALARAGETAVAEAALADRHPTVREVARGALRRAGGDPAEHYRTLVRATEPADPAAVAGLGETGARADAELVRPSLADHRARGRVEAVRALRRLRSVDVAPLVDMLDDPSAPVTRQVVTTLVPRASEISGDRLAELMDGQCRPHVRSAAYRLLRAQGVWTRVLTDLELYDDGDERVRGRARADLLAWLNREAATSYSMPAGDTLERLDVLVRRVAPSLGPSRERLLRFHLGLADTP